MNGFALRIIAMTTMLTDHIGWTFLDNPMLLTWIGRIAFPLYAFLLAEGYRHVFRDRERLTRHLVTLLILAVVAEPGYDLMDAHLNFAEYLSSQSNMITLLLGYLGMMATEALFPSDPSERGGVSRTRIAALACAYGLLGFANYMMHGNFNLVDPWLVVACYWYIRKYNDSAAAGNTWSWSRRFLTLLLIIACYLPIYFWVRSGFGDLARWCEEVVRYAPWIVGHVLAVLILSFYNGERGYRAAWFGRLYTAFYPAHKYVLGVLYLLTGRA